MTARLRRSRACARARGIQALFLTNDPQSSRSERHPLAAIGIPATEAHVLTSTAATARFLASRQRLTGAELFAIGSPTLYSELVQVGFTLLSATDAPREGPWPATGAILAAVETATGVTATVVGKPEPIVFEIARGALAGCKQIAVIGDHLTADVAGAKRAGLDAILVLTGTTHEEDVAQADVQPDLVLPSLAALAAPSFGT